MKVTTQRLEEQASQLREISYRMRSIQDTVLRTAQILSREEIGERFRWPIITAAAAVEKRQEDLMKLSRALQDIAMIYERTERDIVDETEEANNHFRPFPTGLIPIPHIPLVIIPIDIFNRTDVIYDHSQWFRDQHERIERDAILDQLRDTWYRVIDPRRDYPRPRVPGIDWRDLPDAEDIWIPREGITPVEPENRWEDVLDTFEPIVVPPTPTPDIPILTAAPDTQRTIENLSQPLGAGGNIGTGIGGVIDWTPWDP